MNVATKGTFMGNMSKGFPILMAEDDEDDRLLAQTALREAHLANEIRFVPDGVHLLDYLQHRGQYADAHSYPRPSLILLDLNLPRKNGWEALAEIRADTDLHMIPVVALTTSRSERDILRSYHLGVNSYITKPANYSELVRAMKALSDDWFDTVTLPCEIP
jgi:CheY-like chemotaxis protein